MKCVSNDLYLEVETWDDPGDYPNGIAGGPLPSYSYLSCGGSLVLEAENQEEIESFAEVDDWFDDWINCGREASKIGAYVDVPSDASVDWIFNVEGNRLTVTIGDKSEMREPDYDYDYCEPDYDY